VGLLWAPKDIRWEIIRITKAHMMVRLQVIWLLMQLLAVQWMLQWIKVVPLQLVQKPLQKVELLVKKRKT